jgi:8-oxo-dGTP pyrophosphatase MutT (NUDIX family)
LNWLACIPGERRHWGRNGAAGLLVAVREDDRTYVLLDERADWVHHGGTFGVPGGAIHTAERPFDAALREVAEEIRGLDIAQLDVLRAHVHACADCDRWSYTTFLATLPARVDVAACSAESEGVHWVDVEDVAGLRLHPGFKAAWPELREELTG